MIIADIPQFHFTGGGVATVNDSAGAIPAHLNTLRLKGSRGQIDGTDTQFITDPDTAGNGIAAVIVDVDARHRYLRAHLRRCGIDEPC